MHLYYVSSNVTQVIDVVHMNAQVMNQNKLIQIEVEEVHFLGENWL